MLLFTGINKSLDEVTYKDVHIHDLIVRSFENLGFMGLKGYTELGSSGLPAAIIEIMQQQGNV